MSLMLGNSLHTFIYIGFAWLLRWSHFLFSILMPERYIRSVRENTNLLLAFSIFRAKNSSIYLLFCLLVFTNFSYPCKKIWLDAKEFINIAKMLMASPTQWTWIWVGSGSWWWTGRSWPAGPWGRKELDTTERLNWTEVTELEVLDLEKEREGRTHFILSYELHCF